jgi:Na+/H+-dicarboxylate symporter
MKRLSLLSIPEHGGEVNPSGRTSKCRELFFGTPGILAGAFVGITVGVLLQMAHLSEEAISWIELPGTLFIRAIKCLVIPLVFVSLIVGLADLLAVGKAGAIGWRTALWYFFTTFCAVCQGTLWAFLFKNLFGDSSGSENDTKIPEFALECSSQKGYYLTQINETSVGCVFDQSFNETNKFSPSTLFIAHDVNKVFATAKEEFVMRSVSGAIQGQFFAMVPSNITSAFAEGILLSVIMFAIPCGIAISLLPSHHKVVTDFFRELNMVFMQMIGWIILCTPIAIISLLASSIASQEELIGLLSSVCMFIICNLVGLFVHQFVFYPVLLRAFVKCNPFKWIFQMARAQIFAFGCASSMATLPIIIECVDATNQVSKNLSRFVLYLGATIGMDGSALGYPICIVFMAQAQGLGDHLGSSEYLLLILVTTISAIGSGPVPSGGLVMTMTIWSSIFPHIPLPSTFAFVIAIDWLVDRFQTSVNVLNDAIVCRIVAQQVGEIMTEEDEEAARPSLMSALDGYLQQNPNLKQAVEACEQE